MAVTGEETESAATGDMPTYQMRLSPTATHSSSSSSSSSSSITMATSPHTHTLTHTHSSLKHTHSEDVSRKREVRLLKNREAARECRRKKKEYVKCLENRVAVLENQNRTLIEELKALKDIYCHKTD